jgi:L-seryl-tRNA(Ser) seleniumtransferase
MAARSRTGRRAADRRRDVPSVDALLRDPSVRKASGTFGRALVKRSLVHALDEVRAAAAAGAEVPDPTDILAHGLERAARDFYGIDEVLNATGVLLHTGLGRAPLAGEASRAAGRAARGYADLEIDRETGGRGRRTARAERLLCALTGAEDALVVNNNAAALLLALAALASRKEVLVSRGELIEIGGEFRLPDIMAASGAKLVEVGTTNRTRIGDYRRALGPKTGLILKVHPSNYRVVGFTNTVEAADLAGLAGAYGVPFANDVGSGLLERYPGVPADEPSVAETLAASAGLVCFSGDKLLGGPQAGLVVGRGDLVARLRKHPIARAVRLDKMTVGALEATLRLYASGRRLEIPLWAMLSRPQRTLMARARALASGVPGASARPSDAVFGGGSLPGHTIPSAALVLPAVDPVRLAGRLRLGRPAVFCRTGDADVSFDLRTVPPGDDERLARAIRYALQQG